MIRTHIWLATFILSLSFSFVATGAENPNVILFMADDMGMGDMGAYQDITGNSDDDQVATSGMQRFAWQIIAPTGHCAEGFSKPAVS